MRGKLYRHTVVLLISVVLLLGAMYYHLEVPGHTIWRAFGDVSYVLLAFSLMLGPLIRLMPMLGKLLPWRRQFGLWFFYFGVLHLVWILNFAYLWDIRKIFGFQMRGDRVLFLANEVGFANTMALVALLIGAVLAATSVDKAVERLGQRSWKWIQNFAHVVFYLLTFHVVYFYFFRRPIEQTLTLFDVILLVLVGLVLVLQMLAYLKSISTKNA